MRIADFVITAGLVAGLSGTALAQTSSSVQTPTPVAPPTTYSEPGDHWFASAYLGSNFGAAGSTAFENLNDLGIDRGSTQSINYGGEVGYVWGGFGAEFMANWAPNFEMNDVLLDRRPRVASYMINALAAIPVDPDHKFRPFVSGGIGSIHLNATTFVIDPSATVLNINTIGTDTTNHSQFGWDLGGGVYAFNGPWGLRADVRYFKATTDDTLNDGTLRGIFLERQLSGLSYWNANFGIAFRW